MMPKPQSLEEWAHACTHKPASVHDDPWRAHSLCRGCAHAYARQQAEAMREQIMAEISKFLSYSSVLENEKDVIQAILSAIRTLPSPTPTCNG